jgi:hypothetical protein
MVAQMEVDRLILQMKKRALDLSFSLKQQNRVGETQASKYPLLISFNQDS